MAGPIFGTLLGGNELCKEGLITATALTWTEPFCLFKVNPEEGEQNT